MKRDYVFVQDREGNAVAGAEVYIRDASENLVTIYSDNGSTTQTNPMSTDNDGKCNFFAADGTYNIRIFVEGVEQEAVLGHQHYDESGQLEAANNLSDVSNVSTARTNLGLPYGVAADVQAGTATAKVIAPDQLMLAAAPQTLTDGASIDWNMATGYNAKVTLAGNRTLNAPSNPHVGLCSVLEVIQDGTGSRTLTWNSCYDFGAGGSPTLSTAAGARDIISMYCYDAGTPKFRCSFNQSA